MVILFKNINTKLSTTNSFRAMKKIITLIGILAPLFIFGQLSNDQNYVHTVQYTEPIQTDSDANPNQKIETVTYYDGVGRPKQSIGLRQGGASQSIVKHYEYDQLGRQAKSYLPFILNETTANHQALVADPLTKTEAFYFTDKYEKTTNPYSQTVFENSPMGRPIEQANVGNDWALGANHTTTATYAVNTIDDKVYDFDVIFEGNDASKPKLIFNSFYAKNTLQKISLKNENGTSSGKKHTTDQFTDINGNVVLTRSYVRSETNVGNYENVDTYNLYDDFGNLTYVLSPKATDAIFTTPPYQDFTQTISTPTLLGGFFFNKQADINIALIGNQLALDFSYTGRSSAELQTGQILTLPYHLPDMIIGTIAVPGVYSYQFSIENGYFTITGSGVLPGKRRIGTNYTITVPDNNPTIDPDAITNLGYQYKYDAKNRLIERKVSGSGWESIVYDKLNRPVLTQDAKLAIDNKWLFVKYDVLNRPVYTGIYTGTNISTREYLQTKLDNQSGDLLQAYHEVKSYPTPITLDGTQIHYTNTAFPNENLTLLSVNYYDTYEFDVNSGTPNMTQTLGQTVSTKTIGLVLGAKERILGTTQWIDSVVYYDTDAQPIYTSATNSYLSTTDAAAIKYNFSGTVAQTTHDHSMTQLSGVIRVVTIDDFTYDHQLRMLTHKQTITNGISTIHDEELLEKNTYDELGRVTKVSVGNTEASPLQQVDYAFNIRGWLKSINDPNATLTNDVFAMQLNYNNVAKNSNGISALNTQSLYNGNISEVIFKTASDNKKRAYSYTYDNTGRLASAAYKAGDTFTDEVDFYSLNAVTYDKNGNIKILSRNAPDAAFANPIQIDNLNYEYKEKSNQLKKVTDLIANSQGFKDDTSVNDEDYTYDVNGSVIKDENKAITNITFNYLNLPETITVEGQGTIKFVYTASGKKQEKVVNHTTNGIQKTRYAGKFIYSKPSNMPNYSLSFFSTSQGYAESFVDATLFKYVYQYKDHQGNIRASYSDTNNDNQINIATEIVQAKNYYPFGLDHKYQIGTPMAAITMTDHPYAYNGQEQLRDLGLKNITEMTWRKYDNALGRFHGIDALAASTPSLTPYHFANNNPIYFSDPSGLKSKAPDYSSFWNTIMSEANAFLASGDEWGQQWEIYNANGNAGGSGGSFNSFISVSGGGGSGGGSGVGHYTQVTTSRTWAGRQLYLLTHRNAKGNANWFNVTKSVFHPNTEFNNFVDANNSNTPLNEVFMMFINHIDTNMCNGQCVNEMVGNNNYSSVKEAVNKIPFLKKLHNKVGNPKLIELPNISGNPHYRPIMHDVIFTKPVYKNNTLLVSTVIHEFVHAYQSYVPIEGLGGLTMRGYMEKYYGSASSQYGVESFSQKFLEAQSYFYELIRGQGSSRTEGEYQSRWNDIFK